MIATVMSNGGLDDYLKSLDISMKRTQVGDRYVWKEMKETGLNLVVNNQDMLSLQTVELQEMDL
ncbi:MAG: hypothetical protein R2883_08485 [Caldisericia bacterium]